MALSSFNKQVILRGVISFFILLWVYAATVKLLEFEDFGIQLGQSPLLSAYAGILVWLVPLSEYILSVLLLLPKTRKVGLYGSLCLMTAFTTYIIIILNYADFVPCSCGGILEALGWTEHLLFNGVCLFLAATAFLFAAQNSKSPITGLKRTEILKLCAGVLGSAVWVIVLFLTSEEQMHRNNAFIRRYPQHVAKVKAKINLGYNSYYIAGITNDSIYLGNTTAPLHIIATDTKLQDTIHHRLHLKDMDQYSFRSLQFRVLDTMYYLSDGSVPVIFTDTIGKWRPSRILKTEYSFYKLQPLHNSTFAVLTANKETGDHELGLLSFKDTVAFHIAPELLEKQVDGIFDVDGFLRYNESQDKLIYVYHYRNEYLVMNNMLKLEHSAKTIDTLSQAQLDIATSSTTLKIGPKSIAVHLNAATAGHYLYLRSDRLGQYEPAEMLEEASIIDVYDLQDKSYVLSFYLYDYKGHSMRNFMVKGDQLYAIYDTYLIKYTLKADAFKF